MTYDVVIVGGGLVGASLAMALSTSSLRVALIDEKPHASLNDARLIALNFGSSTFLKKVGALHSLESEAGFIESVHVSRRGHFGVTRLKASELNLPFLGLVLPAYFLNQTLENALKHTSIELIRPAKLTHLSQEPDKVRLTLATGQGEKIIQANWVVGADGSHSTVRSLLAIPTKTHDYHQQAIVTITQLKRDHQGIAFERFLKDGAIAMLPLSGHRSATIWTSSNDNSARLMALSEVAFLEQLQKEFGDRLGRLQHIEKRMTYPLRYLAVKQQKQDRVLLIGNAAHTLHPLAAQGFNVALQEVASLSHWFLEKKEDQAPFSENKMHHLAHGLNALFGIDFLPVNLARQIGLVGLDVCQSLKRKFAAFPAGLHFK